jgi:putative ABC transport system permease protein
MSAVSRAVGNVFRKKVRSLFVILIIGFCIAIFVTMSVVNSNIADRESDISANSAAATEITVRPAGQGGYGGFGGFGGPSSAMSESVITTIKAQADILSVQPVITQFEGSFQSGTRPVIVQGEDPSQPLVLMGGGSISTTSGRSLNSGDEDAMVAIVGTDYATGHSVSVGSTITLNSSYTLTIVGIYSTGNTFGNDGITIPYDTAKTVYDVSGPNSIFVTVNYAGNVQSVVTTLQGVLGPNYDVVSVSSLESQIQDSLNDIYQNSATGLYISLITAVAVMIFVMILITRERTKEIGVLKAIGFKNKTIVAQFFTESVVLAVLGFVVGVVLAEVAGPTLATMFLSSSTSSGFGGPPGAGHMGGTFGGLSFNLQPELLVYTLVLAVALGIIGSLYPIIRAMQLKPAEALRYD